MSTTFVIGRRETPRTARSEFPRAREYGTAGDRLRRGHASGGSATEMAWSTASKVFNWAGRAGLRLGTICVASLRGGYNSFADQSKLPELQRCFTHIASQYFELRNERRDTEHTLSTARDTEHTLSTANVKKCLELANAEVSQIFVATLVLSVVQHVVFRVLNKSIGCIPGIGCSLSVMRKICHLGTLGVLYELHGLKRACMEGSRVFKVQLVEVRGNLEDLDAVSVACVLEEVAASVLRVASDHSYLLCASTVLQGAVEEQETFWSRDGREESMPNTAKLVKLAQQASPSKKPREVTRETRREDSFADDLERESARLVRTWSSRHSSDHLAD